MSPILLALCMGALEFLDQELPWVRVERINWLTGCTALNCRVEDMTGDGLADLLTPEGIIVQSSNGFTAEPVPFPDAINGLTCDVFGRQIFVRGSNKLLAYTFRDAQWTETLKQEISWPRMDLRDFPESIPANARGVVFGTFTHDLDSDGIPEIVAPGLDTVRIYAIRDGRFTMTVDLDVYPPLITRFEGSPPLWPMHQRYLDLPVRESACRVSMDGNTMSVLTNEPVGPDTLSHHLARFKLDPGNGFQKTSEPGESQEAGPLPVHLLPCNLNGDRLLDFAGVTETSVDAAPFPIPVCNIDISTDGGVTVQTFRSTSRRPRYVFTDFNHDGSLDLIMEDTHAFDGGIRESLTRLFTSNNIRHSIRVHLQRDGVFSREPFASGTVTLHFPTAPGRGMSAMLSQYRSRDGLLDVSGDFDGDRQNDLVVQDTPGEVSVYLCRNAGFERKAAARIPLRQDMDFAVTDVDRDGRADIVLNSASLIADPVGRSRPAHARVLLSRGAIQ